MLSFNQNVPHALKNVIPSPPKQLDDYGSMGGMSSPINSYLLEVPGTFDETSQLNSNGDLPTAKDLMLEDSI